MNFGVWAPGAQLVELDLGTDRLEMRQLPGGWWGLDVPGVRAGADYSFRVDGGPPRPDPRSMDQPHGVHGPSRVVDHDAYQWEHPGFRAPPIASGVVYELHVGTFTDEGTLDAAADRLDHLVSLGVTHVELMPLNAYDGDHGWGYDGVGWFCPHRAYTGQDGPDAVKRFVDRCHARGLGVILDVVYNHLGPSGNYLREFGPYFTDHYSTPWGEAINLDGPGSDEVRRLIRDSALLWLGEYRFDGLRLDAVHALHDRSAVHLLEMLAREVRAFEARTGRSVFLIAESDLNDPRLVRSLDAGGCGLDAQWSDDFHHALHALLTGESKGYYQDFGGVEPLARAWDHAFVNDGRFSTFRERSHGRPADGIDSRRFLAYAQNHDQVGNRAVGDRLASSLDPRALELSAGLVLLSPFVPMLFMGEEWGCRRPFQYFADHRDPDLAKAVREGRRREFRAFGWAPESIPDPQDRATLARSKLDWSELDTHEAQRLIRWHAELIRFRRDRRELGARPVGTETVRWSEDPPWMTSRHGSLTLVFNLGAGGCTIPLGSCRTERASDPKIRLCNDPEARIEQPGSVITLAGHGVAAVERQSTAPTGT